MKAEQQAMLREPFPREAVGILPKPNHRDAQKGKCQVCGGWHGLPAVHLDYVGHAAVTDRLLKVDPEWTWEPVAVDPAGLPAFDTNGGLWIKLTVCGVTRLGYGDADGKRGGSAVKESIGDALRNAAMRFGVALDLWSKEELQPGVEKATSDAHDQPQERPLSEADKAAAALMDAKERAVELARTVKPDLADRQAAGAFVVSALEARGLSKDSVADVLKLCEEWRAAA